MKSPETLPNSSNLPFVEELYRDYQHEPAAVSDNWRRYFADLDNGDGAAQVRLGPSFCPPSLFYTGKAARNSQWAG